MKTNKQSYKRIAKVFILAAIASIIVASIFLLIQISQSDLSSEDSEALYGGRPESGYTSAGYLIVYTDQSVKTCGYTAIRPNVAVTAGHCVDDATRIYLGQGPFDFNHENHARANRAETKQGWVENKERQDDFSVITFRDPNFFSDFANISSPVEGCNMRVVAYGRTENPNDTGDKLRKSAGFCATAIFDNIFYAQGQDGGICFGDSGSPVYFDGTNNLVGVVASIIRDPNDTDNNPCAVGNEAIIVRVDSNTEIINENVQLASTQTEPVDIDNDLVIEVAESNDSGLSFASVTNVLSQAEKFAPQIIVVASVLIILIAAYLVLTEDSQNAPTAGGGSDFQY